MFLVVLLCICFHLFTTYAADGSESSLRRAGINHIATIMMIPITLDIHAVVIIKIPPINKAILSHILEVRMKKPTIEQLRAIITIKAVVIARIIFISDTSTPTRIGL